MDVRLFYFHVESSAPQPREPSLPSDYIHYQFRHDLACHTGIGSNAAYRAIFDHYGVIEAQELDDMIDLAVGFLACGDSMPAGKRIGICTASGGAGVWMADACAAADS